MPLCRAPRRLMAAGSPSLRPSHASVADVVLPDYDAPLFPGCLIDVFDAGAWHRGTVLNIDVCGDTGTLRVRRRSGQLVIVGADVAATRLRHCRHTMKAVRHLRLMREAVEAARARRSSKHISRVAKARAAGIKRDPLCQQRPFSERAEASRGRVGPSRLLCLDLCSGPFKSMSLAVNRSLDCAHAVSVDLEEEFAPDVAVDLRVWDLWGFLLENCRSGKDRVQCFLHIHASPPCCTYVMLNNRVNTRTAAEPAAGFASRPSERSADEVSRTIAFFVDQCRRHGLPTTWSVENPHCSMLWKLPCMRRLFSDGALKAVRVDYCMYGNAGKKPTSFAVSPALSRKRKSWAWRCRHSDGGCGALRRASPKAAAYHVGPLSHRLIDSYIPSTLCGMLSCSWVRTHAPLRRDNHSYGTVSVDKARALQAEWLKFASTNSGTLLRRPRQPAVAVAPAAPPSCAARPGPDTTVSAATDSNSTADVPPALSPSGRSLSAEPDRRLSPPVRAVPDVSDGVTLSDLDAILSDRDDSMDIPLILLMPHKRRERGSRAGRIRRLSAVPALRCPRPPPPPSPPGRKRAAGREPSAPRSRRRRSSRRTRVCSFCGSSGVLHGASRPLCAVCASEHSASAPQQLHQTHRSGALARASAPGISPLPGPASEAVAACPGSPSRLLTTASAPTASAAAKPEPTAPAPLRQRAAGLRALAEVILLDSGDILFASSSPIAL